MTKLDQELYAALDELKRRLSHCSGHKAISAMVHTDIQSGPVYYVHLASQCEQSTVSLEDAIRKLEILNMPPPAGFDQIDLCELGI